MWQSAGKKDLSAQFPVDHKTVCVIRIVSFRCPDLFFPILLEYL